jgi:hypothetical protein
MVDDAPKAKQYYSDAFDAFDRFGITLADMKFPKSKPI